MTSVYILQSISDSSRHYVGLTTNLHVRLTEHNAGKSSYTAKFRPWKVVVVIQFDNCRRAQEFERYLKSGSGYAFMKKHFW